MTKTQTRTPASTQTGSVRSFDHTGLSLLPAYHALRRALSDLLNEADAAGMDTGWPEFLDAIKDMAASAPYGDCCSECGGSVLDDEAWLHAGRGTRDAGQELAHWQLPVQPGPHLDL
jgi:hypothetical protein